MEALFRTINTLVYSMYEQANGKKKGQGGKDSVIKAPLCFMIKRIFFGFIVVFTEIKAHEMEFKSVTAAGQLILAVPVLSFLGLLGIPFFFNPLK